MVTTIPALLQGFNLKEFYLIELKTANFPFVRRLFQILQVQSALDLTTKVIDSYQLPFSISSKINTVCLFSGLFSNFCSNLEKNNGHQYNPCIRFGIWLDRKWSKISEAGRLVSVAASIALIASGELAFGSIVLGFIGLGYLESKEFVHLKISEYLRKSVKVLNYAVLVAAIIAGSTTHIVYLTYTLGNKLIDYVGFKYFPLSEKLPVDAEHHLVEAMRTPPNYIASTKDISDEHLQWRAIPRFFTHQSPYQKRWDNPDSPLKMLQFFKKTTLEVWLQKSDHIDEIKTKTNKLIEIHSTIIDLCSKLYLSEKTKIIFNDKRDDLEEKYLKIKVLECSKNSLLNEIFLLLNEDEKKSFAQTIAIQNYQRSEVENLKKDLEVLKNEFDDFKKTSHFDAQQDNHLFIRLSLLGLLQWQRKEIAKDMFNIMFPFETNLVSFFMCCYLSKSLGLRESQEEGSFYLMGLIINYTCNLNIYDQYDSGEILNFAHNFVETLPLTSKTPMIETTKYLKQIGF